MTWVDWPKRGGSQGHEPRQQPMGVSESSGRSILPLPRGPTDEEDRDRLIEAWPGPLRRTTAVHRAVGEERRRARGRPVTLSFGYFWSIRTTASQSVPGGSPAWASHHRR